MARVQIRRDAPSPAAINRREYGRRKTVEVIRRREGWVDGGERIMVNRVADDVRGQPILDIGVGGGRTAWMLRPLSADYVAIDYSSEMVEACRSEYPGLDVRECDARDLSMFADETFALVFFSFNGIDILNHEGRLSALREMIRVLRPGGVMLYSTSNMNGPLYQRRPWHVWQRSTKQAVKGILNLKRNLPRYGRTYRNWWLSRRYSENHGSWAICTSGAYEFGVVIHWTLPSTEQGVLESMGVGIEELRAREGEPLEGDSSTTRYFYVLARKPSVARGTSSTPT